MIATLPIVFALLGLVFSTRTWIKALDKLPPYSGLVVYYIIITITILLLQYFGLVIGGTEYKDWRHTIGSLLVIFSFFIIFDWESCYINIVTKGHCDESKVSNVYFDSEDGAVYDLYNRMFPNKVELNRTLTYVITPFILSLLGVILLSDKKVVL